MNANGREEREEVNGVADERGVEDGERRERGRGSESE